MSQEDSIIIANRDPDLGQPIGKGDAAVPPILLAKLGRGQEIELTCRAYRVSSVFHFLFGQIFICGKGREGNRKILRSM